MAEIIIEKNKKIYIFSLTLFHFLVLLRDFVTNLLLCQETFQTPSQDMFLRLTQASVLPFYLLVLSICLLSTLQTIYRRLRSRLAALHWHAASGEGALSQ